MGPAPVPGRRHGGSILAILGETRECRFSTLRDELQLTDGNLNRHLKILKDAELLKVRKGYEGRRPCTWLRLTRQGRDALRHEITTLEQLVHRVRGTPASPPTQPATADPDGTAVP